MVFALAYSALLLGVNLWALAALLLLAGATNSLTIIAIYQMAEVLADEHNHTETMAWVSASNAFGTAVGTALAGALVDRHSEYVGLFLVALSAWLIVAATLAGATNFRRAAA